MTRVLQTWMCLRCQSLTERAWFIGGEAALVGDSKTRCRACGSANMNLGASSCDTKWEGDFIVAFGEESV